ncbi:hypothetical protein [Parapedobacter pyrenivorans]|uniref:hypothetical protein n=1 Tax=Parapedobacter pyrenivorans TaxID=1305674 RepID=UPI0033412520
MKNPVPQNNVVETVKKTLLNANKFALNSWYTEIKKYEKDGTGYLILDYPGADNEMRYRYPAGMAFGLAISLKTGVYDELETGQPYAEALQKTILLLTSVAHDHRTNKTRCAWGDDWQAALWAYYAAYAGWLLWNHLGEKDRAYVVNMVIAEADRLLLVPPPFYKDKAGTALFPGDSKIEENLWNAELLSLASVMMPMHVNSERWLHQAISYTITGLSLPSDLQNEDILHGKPVKSWLNGYNVEEPGIVINHHIIHPLYNAVSSVVNVPIVFSLAGVCTPKAFRFNMDKIYRSLINTPFDSSRYEKPGGTMYIKGSPNLYYPEGSSWGFEIYDPFANMDVAAWLYQFDDGQDYGGYYWAGLHAGAVLTQQERFDDGHTYLDNQENSYSGKEEAIATRMASAWMSIWVEHQRSVCYTNTNH